MFYILIFSADIKSQTAPIGENVTDLPEQFGKYFNI